MSENSKEMADAGSFGLKAGFHARRPIPTGEFVSLIEGLLRGVGSKAVEARGFLLGHIKAFVTAEHGTLKVNLIDMDIGPETVDRLASPTVERGEIKFMAALIGLGDHDIGEIMEGSLEMLGERMELDIEEHGHDHEDHH